MAGFFYIPLFFARFLPGRGIFSGAEYPIAGASALDTSALDTNALDTNAGGAAGCFSGGAG